VHAEHVQNIAICRSGNSVCDSFAHGIIVQSILLARVNLRETSTYRGECGFALSTNRRLYSIRPATKHNSAPLQLPQEPGVPLDSSGVNEESGIGISWISRIDTLQWTQFIQVIDIDVRGKKDHHVQSIGYRA